MGRHPTEACMKRTRTIMTGIRDSFTKLQGGTWLVAKRMDFAQDHTTHTYANRVLRALVQQKVLERQQNPAHKQGIEWLYRPTVAGYQMLEAIDSFPLDELHKRFAGARLEPVARRRPARRARLPLGFSTRTMVGGPPDNMVLLANQKHLLDQVKALAAEVDDLKGRFAQARIDQLAAGVSPTHSKKGNGLPQDVLAIIGRAVLDGRA